MKSFVILILFLLATATSKSAPRTLSGEEWERAYVEQEIKRICSTNAQERASALSDWSSSVYSLRKAKAHRAKLLACLKDYEISAASAIIMGMIDPPVDIKAKMLESKTVPDKVKARLGDKEAEKRVIAAFEKASPERKMDNTYSYGEELLYIDSSESIRAFLRGVESKEAYETVFEQTESVAWRLLAMYSKVYPEVKLFSSSTTSPHLHLTTEAEFQQKEHQRYLRMVEEYFHKQYKVKIHIKAKFLVLGGTPIIE